MASVESKADQIFTIGHSNHPPERFLCLLLAHGIEVLVDIRSSPYSRYAPQFNRETLLRSITDVGLEYLYLGNELGGRPEGDEFYDDQGYVRYDEVARSARFLHGIARLEATVPSRRVAILCSEEDPIGCHRRLLVGRVLEERGIDVRHLRADGSIQAESALKERDEACASLQLSLFGEETREWKSSRPVLPRSQRNSSSTS